MKEYEISNQPDELRNSQSSINSNPELKNKRIFYLRISLILINVISLILGIYIWKDKEYYLNPEYNFEYQELLLIFIILYSLGMLSTFFVALIFSLIIKLFVFIASIFLNKDNISLIKGEENPPSENSFRYIKSHSDKIGLVPYTITWFVVTTVIIYFLSLPYSIFLLIFLQKNKTYENINNFRVLYSFLIINFIAGIILFYVILIITFVKREGSFRKEKISIDDNNLENLKEEIRGALQKAQ